MLKKHPTDPSRHRALPGSAAGAGRSVRGCEESQLGLLTGASSAPLPAGGSFHPDRTDALTAAGPWSSEAEMESVIFINWWVNKRNLLVLISPGYMKLQLQMIFSQILIKKKCMLHQINQRFYDKKNKRVHK